MCGQRNNSLSSMYVCMYAAMQVCVHVYLHVCVCVSLQSTEGMELGEW